MLKLNTYLNRVGTLWRLAMLLLLAFASPNIYAADMYLIGNVNNQGWAANSGYKLTETSSGSGIYYTPDKIKIGSATDGAFGLASELGSTNDDAGWGTVNSHRFYPGESKGFALDNDISFHGSNQNQGDSWDAGNYKNQEFYVFVNTNTNNIRFSNSGFIPWFEPLYLVGGEYGWDNKSDNQRFWTLDGKVYTLTLADGLKKGDYGWKIWNGKKDGNNWVYFFGAGSGQPKANIEYNDAWYKSENNFTTETSGETTITFTLSDQYDWNNGKTPCKLLISAVEKELTLDRNSIILTKGASETLTATLSGATGNIRTNCKNAG